MYRGRISISRAWPGRTENSGRSRPHGARAGACASSIASSPIHTSESAVTETWFYHLEKSGLEDVLPNLLERTRARGQKAAVRVGSAERMETLDTHLWTYSDQTFLAHGTAADGHASRQPIYLTTENENRNTAQVLFLVDGAVPEDWSSPTLRAYERIVLLFDGRDEGALNAARVQWRNSKEAGHEVTYWKESSTGKWEKQG